MIQILVFNSLFQRQRLLIQAFQTSTWRARVPVKRKVKLQVTVFLRFLMNILEGRRGVELLLLAQELYRCKVCKKKNPLFLHNIKKELSTLWPRKSAVHRTLQRLRQRQQFLHRQAASTARMRGQPQGCRHI